MPDPTLETDLRSPLELWWETGRRDGAAAMRVFGNRALTSWAGLLLLPGLAVVALSGLLFRNFWQLHYIAGLSLIPLLLVKLGSTTYRARSYYRRRAVYRAAGAPEWVGRLLAPALIVSTIIAMATGIWMWSQHSEAQPWAKLHVLSVLAMGACVGLHLLLRTPVSLQAVARDGVAPLRHNLPRIRIALVGIALAIGLIVGVAGGARSPFPTRSTREAPERSTVVHPASDLASEPLRPPAGSHSWVRRLNTSRSASAIGQRPGPANGTLSGARPGQSSFRRQNRHIPSVQWE
jgi:hypothetical protein